MSTIATTAPVADAPCTGDLQMLQIFKTEALEQLLENEVVICQQRERIKELEFHLRKCRDSAYLIVTATVGVVPLECAADAKPAKKSKAET